MNDIGIEENKINKTEMFYIDDYVTLYQGDSRDVLRTLPDASVNCCVTSPPYYGLRSYMPDAVKLRDDLTPEEREYVERDLASLNVHPTMAISYRKSEIPDHLQQYFQPLEIGLEQTPQEYVDELVAVFREVRRVLRNNGTLWLNLGDSYNGYMANQHGTGLETKRQAARKYIEPGAGLRFKGLKNKDLIGIPWRVAFALQADGWYLRQDIIWHKPNPMPESIRDRCTKAHEYIFLLSKSPRYYFDNEAIKEQAVGRNPGNTKPTKGGRAYADGEAKHRTAANLHEIGPVERRNKRSVWTVTTKPFKGAHFATYPPDLIKPCILAGCPVGGTVIDPFAGSGTTGRTAKDMQRKSILVELNKSYCEIAAARILGKYGK